MAASITNSAEGLQAPARPPTAARVLLVEDDERLAELIAEYLGRL